MISRELFVDVMQRIMKHREYVEDLETAIGKFGYEYVGLDVEDDCDLEQCLIDVISSDLDDRNGWISYFLYEREGDLSKPCVTDQDNHIIDTSDWGKVYDMLLGKWKTAS